MQKYLVSRNRKLQTKMKKKNTNTNLHQYWSLKKIH